MTDFTVWLTYIIVSENNYKTKKLKKLSSLCPKKFIIYNYAYHVTYVNMYANVYMTCIDKIKRNADGVAKTETSSVASFSSFLPDCLQMNI